MEFVYVVPLKVLLQAQGHRHNIESKKERKKEAGADLIDEYGHCQSDKRQKSNCFRGNFVVGWSAYMGFSTHFSATLSGTAL